MYKKISGFSDEIASDIKTQFAVLNKLGISYFELRGADGKNVADLTDEEVLNLKAVMDKNNIKASSIGSPIGKVKLTDDLDAHFELFKKVVKIANILDTSYIRLFSFYHDGDRWTKEERNMVIKRLSDMISYAEKNHVVLLHENEKDIYGDNIERCLDLMHNLYGKHFKAVFDPANFVQCGQDTKKAYKKLDPYIAYMHIKDARLNDGCVVPAGYGDGNLKFILDSLFQKGYDGFLSLEPHLGSFEGLDALELTDVTKNLPKGGEETYMLAFRSLLELLQGGKIS